MSDRQDEQRPAPEGDAPVAPPWSAEPVRRTDGQRGEASVESWSATSSTAQPDGGERRPSWEQDPAGSPGSGADSPSWQQPSWSTGGQQAWTPAPSWGPPSAGVPEQARPRIAPATRPAYLELSAAVSDGFALPPLQRKPAAQA